MVTQYINVSTTGVTQLILNFSITVTTDLNCGGGACSELVEIRKYETNKLDENGRSDPDSYSDNLVTLNFQSMGAKMQQNFSKTITINESPTGLYLAVVGPSSSQICVHVSHIALFYYVCPEQELNLVKYPEVIAPVLSKMTIQVSCIDNAMLSPFSPLLTAECTLNGVWAYDNISCQCEEGYFVTNQSKRQICQGRCCRSRQWFCTEGRGGLSLVSIHYSTISIR